MLTSLDHVIIAVRDLDDSCRAYETLLGLSPSWRGEHPDYGTANVLFRLDNTYVELLAPSGSGPLGKLLCARLASEGEGMVGLAFGTGDLEGCVASLAERNFQPGPIESGSGHDTRTGAVRRWRRAALPLDQTRGLFLFPIQHTTTPESLPRATPSAEPSSAVHALDHVVVQTTDAAAARQLFGEGLGLRLAVDKEFESWGVRLMFFRAGGITVEVAAALGCGGSPLPAPATDRLYGMSYRVGSIDAAQRRIVDSGVDVSEVRKGRRPGTRVCSVRGGTCGVPTLLLEFEEGART
jgi:catechol 2,3-dioxygenase-like lactoylglutathione lyase family enzyme